MYRFRTRGGSLAPIFKRFNPSAPFDYTFVDEEYAHLFAAEQRVKEIGIRKVLGASVFNIWQLFSKDFVTVVLVATFIAIPIAYFVVHHWLEGYEYKAELLWWIFPATWIGILLITLTTVSVHAIKAALANPARSLRPE